MAVSVHALLSQFRSARVNQISRLSWLRKIPTLSSDVLALLASVYFTLLCNGAFWSAWLNGRDLGGAGTWFAALCVGVFVTGLQGFLLLLVLNRWTAKPLLITLFLLTSFAVYFMTQYGVYLNRSMLRNLIETDVKEASELFQWKLAAFVFMYGVLPSLLLWRVNVQRHAWKRAIRRRCGALLLALIATAAGLWAAMHEIVPTFRAHKEVRYLITPSNYAYALVSAISGGVQDAAQPRTTIGPDAHQITSLATRKPRVFVMVVGETVRAANWGLNGYARQTTPELAARDVINFPYVTSCGTDTAVSVPCMFSVYGRHDYHEERIRRSESLLHMIERAGVSTLWRDNQAGCKGVCDGLAYERLSNKNVEGLCHDGRCMDEILLMDLKKKIASSKGDLLVVLHMLGNHGPAYYQRYPSAYRHWQPTCDTTDLASCSREALVNTYDNATGYGDHVLALAIDLLGGITSHDAGLLYVSDHGESLGEYNLYLHGMPYAIAAKEQTQVPMIVWLSPGLASSAKLDRACLEKRAAQPAAHDHLFHTVLGVFDVRSTVYDPSWDLARECRQ